MSFLSDSYKKSREEFQQVLAKPQGAQFI